MVLSVGDIQARAGLEDELGPGLEELSKKVDSFAEKLEKTLGKSADSANEKMEETGGAFAKVLEGVELGAGIELFNTFAEKVSEVSEYLFEAAGHVGEFAEHLENLGAQTGFASDSLDVFSKIGGIVNVSVDQMAMSMNRAQRAIESGSKGATDAFNRMGIDVQKFRALKPEEQFEKMFEGLGKIPEGAQRTTAAMELLGRSGAQMLPLVGHIKDLEVRLKDLGVTMSKDSIAAASAFDDKMDILGIVMDSFREKLGAAVTASPALQQALDEITNLLGLASKFMEENLDTMTSWIDRGILLAADALQTLIGWLLDAVDAMQAGAAAVVELWDGLIAIDEAMQAFAGAISGPFVDAWNAGLAAIQGVLAGFDAAGTATSALSSIVDEAKIEWNAFWLSIKTVAEYVLVLAENMLRAQAAVKGFKGDTEGATHAMEAANALEKLRAKYLETSDAIEAANKKNASSTDSFRAKLDEMVKRLHAAVEGAKKADEPGGPGGGAPRALPISDEAKKALEAYDKEVEKLQGELEKMGGVGQDAFDQQRTAAMTAYDAEMRHIDSMKLLTVAQKENLQAGALQLEQAKLEQIGVDQLAKSYADAAAVRKTIDDQLTSSQQKLEEAYRSTLSPLQQQIQKNQELADKTIDAVNAAYKKAQATGQDTDADLENVQAVTQNALALRDYNDALAKAAAEQLHHIQVMDAFTDSLFSVVGLLNDLGAGETFAATALGGLSKGMETATQAAKQGFLSFSQMAGAIGDIFKTGADKGAGAGAMSGAMQGGAIGALFGPMGAAAGAVAGGLIGALGGIFGKPEWKKVGENAGKILGYAVGDETAKAMTETMHKAGVSMEQAILLNLDKIMVDTGKTIGQMGSQVLELINTKFAAGSEAAKQQADQIDKAWSAVRDTATEVGDAMTVAMFQSAKAAGTMTQSMKDFEKAQQDLGIGGAKKIAEGLAMIKPEDLAKFENFGPVAASFFTKGFQDAIDKEGLVGALDDFGDSLTSVYEQMQKTFPTQSSSAILAPFVNLKNVLDADDGTLKGMITTVEGMGDVLESNANRGLFDPEMQSAMGDALNQTFNLLKDKTGDAKTSIQAILPELTKTIQASQQLGVPLDENTKKLKEQAETMGFAFPAEPIVQLVDLMKALVTGLGFALPQSAQQSATALDNLGKTGEASLTAASDTVAALGDTTVAHFSTMSSDTAAVISDVLGQSIDSMGQISQSGIDSADTVSTAWNGTVSKIGMFVEDAVAPVSDSFQTMSDESSEPLNMLLSKLNGIANATGAIGSNAASSTTALQNMGGAAPKVEGGGPPLPPGTPEYDVGGEGIAGVGPYAKGGSAIIVHPGEHYQVSTSTDTKKQMQRMQPITIQDNRSFTFHGAGNDREIVNTFKKHLNDDTEGLRALVKKHAQGPRHSL